MAEDLTRKYEKIFGKELIEGVADERGISPAELIIETETNQQRVTNLKRSPNGKYRVIGIDRFDGEDWLQNEYNTPQEALEEARRLTREAMPSATSETIATVYYAYDPEGNFLGGNEPWREKKTKKNGLFYSFS